MRIRSKLGCAHIHKGIVLSNRDKRTLIDKANEMLKSVCKDQTS
jgi:hypothetical protein